MIPLPDPPLVWPPPDEPARAREVALVLRPWRRGDAPALVAGWADPDVQRWTGVPEGRDLAAAARWIAGDEARRAGGLCLDLAVETSGGAVGEVGFVPSAAAAGTVEMGWWVARAHRGRGIASTGARLLAAWVQATLGLSVVASCDPANPASAAVAAKAGFHLGWTEGTREIWVRP